MFLVIIIIISVLAAFICMWKRFRWGSSLMRSWFPLFSRSGYHRGTCRAEIFVEVTETSSHKSIWAMFKKVSIHPTALRYGGVLSSRDITIIKNCGCRTMRINWENVEIQGEKQNTAKYACDRCGIYMDIERSESLRQTSTIHCNYNG